MAVIIRMILTSGGNPPCHPLIFDSKLLEDFLVRSGSSDGRCPDLASSSCASSSARDGTASMRDGMAAVLAALWDVPGAAVPGQLFWGVEVDEKEEKVALPSDALVVSAVAYVKVCSEHCILERCRHMADSCMPDRSAES